MKDELINIENKNGELVVSSKEIASNFNKRHSDVLEKISNLVDEIQPTENSARYFIPNEYKDLKGEMRKEYLLTEKGFSLLVMGFNGKKALDWKIKYIDAFDKMREYINSRPSSLPSDYKEALRQLLAEVEEKEKLQLECKKLEAKANYTDTILKSKEIMPITVIAKDYGMSGTQMNELLNKYGVQYKMNGQWVLYAKYQNKGYVHSETIKFFRRNGELDSVMITKWTQTGRAFIYNFLKKNGILPMIERGNV